MRLEDLWWWPDRECKGRPTKYWFPSSDDKLLFESNDPSYSSGKGFCDRCVGREDCLEFALATHERSGMWGGESPRARRRILRARQRFQRNQRRQRGAFLGALALAALALAPLRAGACSTECGDLSGRSYVICKESGRKHLPSGLRPGRRHSRRSTASGPCGMLADNRRTYGGDDLAACERYMAARYGSWAAAERHHRQKCWW